MVCACGIYLWILRRGRYQIGYANSEKILLSNMLLGRTIWPTAVVLTTAIITTASVIPMSAALRNKNRISRAFYPRCMLLTAATSEGGCPKVL